MGIGIEGVIFYLVLLDSLIANIFSFCVSKNTYNKKFKKMTKIFPMSKGWTVLYLIMVLWIGCLLYRMGSLGF